MPSPSEGTEAVPYFTAIVEPKNGEIGYVVVQAGDIDAAEDAALDAIAEQYDIAADKLEAYMVLGIFEGAAKCLIWGGFPC